MKIVLVGDLPTNCYIIYNDEKNAVIFDPGYEHEKIIKAIESINVLPKAIFLTHAHHDHITATEELIKKYGIPCYCSEAEKAVTYDPKLNLSIYRTGKGVSFIPEKTFYDGEEINIEGIRFRVILTPGHTVGGACFYFEDDRFLISGDTLFNGTIGRTDFPTGSYDDLIDSVNNKLMILDDDITVYPGHGYKTTIAHEKKVNPYVYRKDK